MVEKRKHYWNGRWGRLARRDILLFEDAGLWRIEDRIGGAEGQSRWSEHEQEDTALDCLRDLLAGADEWREI